MKTKRKQMPSNDIAFSGKSQPSQASDGVSTVRLKFNTSSIGQGIYLGITSNGFFYCRQVADRNKRGGDVVFQRQEVL